MTVRQQKVSMQIRRLVGELILRGDVADPRVEDAIARGTIISVTRVEVTPDLREARVYVSVANQRGPASTVLHGLRSATRHLQKTVAEALPIRVAPHLEFRLDETLKKEAAVLKQIDDALADDAKVKMERGQVEPPK